MPSYRTSHFRLQSGFVLPELDIAYECYGDLNAERSNAVLVHHGTTSTHHAVGRTTPDLREGWWDGIIGPGKLLDTDKFCVISSNMLGSSYGTTGPNSLNPETGRAWGADFPEITLEDMVRAQKCLIDALGIDQLLAVAGGSVGGLLSFQWAVTYPRAMRGIIAADCGPVSQFGTSAALPELVAELQADPNWNDGHYAEAGGALGRDDPHPDQNPAVLPVHGKVRRPDAKTGCRETLARNVGGMGRRIRSHEPDRLEFGDRRF
ncbi:alpha/beta fold hydrolase [Shimia aestuarii]|uniref:alpha/beta fold hydrolase n=1 Tax=Shimia aestuarii TaxID=254406 RepID=UPI000B82FFD7|nr:alpha/beta fold hydrolase [Shimia aestuarii]